MKKPDAALASLYCASALHGMIHTLSLFLSPLNVEISTYFRTDSVGAITSFKTAYLIVYAASNLLFGALTHRLPVRQTLSVGMGLNALAVCLFAIVPPDGVALMYLLWIVAALGGGVYHPVANVFITRKFPNRKGWALGITGIGSGVGFAFGPLATGFLSRAGLDWQIIALIFGGLGLLAGVIAYLVIRDDGKDDEAFALAATAKDLLNGEEREDSGIIQSGGGIAQKHQSAGVGGTESVVKTIKGTTGVSAKNVGAISGGESFEGAGSTGKTNDVSGVTHEPIGAGKGVKTTSTRPTLPGGLTWPLLGFLTWMVLLTASREISMWSILDVSAFFLEVSARNASLASWYLFIMYLPGIVTQPFIGAWSDRWGRQGFVLLTFGMFGASLSLLSFLPAGWLFLPYFLMGAAQSASVPLVEAMIADQTTPQNRGMMFGVFITAIMGLGALGPFLSGIWLDGMGKTLTSFRVLFSVLGVAVIFSGICLYGTPRVSRALNLEKTS